MKSEELEQSLRSEFESYLNDVVAKMRADVEEFQKEIESEFEKQRSHISDSFRSFSDRFDHLPEFDGGFKEAVMEHLRLARDEGAQITAAAMAQAEDLERASAPAAVDLSEIKEALDDISSKDTQSAILKSLITHAAKYTPRGAFFIIKNDNFAGWKVFGKEADDGETAIREVHFPLSSDSILGSSVRSLKTVESSFGTYKDDATFLESLHFGQPDRMYAVPLVARGRSVAVLYCDYGHAGVTVNIDALEMLVKIAGLTVELLASARAVQPPAENPSPRQSAYATREYEAPAYSGGDAPAANAEPAQSGSVNDHAVQDSFASSGEVDHTTEPASEEVSPQANEQSEWAEPQTAESEQLQETSDSSSEPTHEWNASAEPAVEQNSVSDSSFDFRSRFDTATEYVPEPSDEEAHVDASDDFVAEPVSDKIAELEQPDTSHSESYSESAAEPWSDASELNSDLANQDFQAADAETSTAPAMVFDDYNTSYDDSADRSATETAVDNSNGTQFQQEDTPPAADHSSAVDVEDNSGGFGVPAAQFETATPTNGSFGTVATPVAEVPSAKPAGTRLSDRNVDLPIEVSDDERRLHNDARRFARLLVSEIKLYNEKKVQEGRESSDLYERLREAIDRSREMYDKRVQPPVAAKFDYFHYELVNSLAEGSEEKLGQTYKGARV